MMLLKTVAGYRNTKECRDFEELIRFRAAGFSTPAAPKRTPKGAKVKIEA